MRADSKQINYVSINPNKKKVIFNMTLHTSLVLSFQYMRFVFLRYRQIIDKKICYIFKRSNLLRKFPKTLKILFKLTCWMEFLFSFHQFIH